MHALPGHTLGPLHHRLHIDELGPVPVQFQDAPTPLDGMILAMRGRVIQQLHRLANGIAKRHHCLVFFSMLSKTGAVSLIFFCGLALSTLRNRKPMRLKTSAIVLGEGNWSSP